MSAKRKFVQHRPSPGKGINRNRKKRECKDIFFVNLWVWFSIEEDGLFNLNFLVLASMQARSWIPPLKMKSFDRRKAGNGISQHYFPTNLAVPSDCPTICRIKPELIYGVTQLCVVLLYLIYYSTYRWKR